MLVAMQSVITPGRCLSKGKLVLKFIVYLKKATVSLFSFVVYLLNIFFNEYCFVSNIIILCVYSSDKYRDSKPSVPRYYGRRKEDHSSSELSIDSDSSDSAEDPKNK